MRGNTWFLVAALVLGCATAEAVRRTTRGVRAVLAVALARTGSKGAVAPLLGVLRGERDPDARPRDDVAGHEDVAAAIQGLVDLGAKEAVPEIRKVAAWRSDPDTPAMRRLRKQAEEALAKLGG